MIYTMDILKNVKVSILPLEVSWTALLLLLLMLFKLYDVLSYVTISKTFWKHKKFYLVLTPEEEPEQGSRKAGGKKGRWPPLGPHPCQVHLWILCHFSLAISAFGAVLYYIYLYYIYFFTTYILTKWTEDERIIRYFTRNTTCQRELGIWKLGFHNWTLRAKRTFEISYSKIHILQTESQIRHRLNDFQKAGILLKMRAETGI